MRIKHGPVVVATRDPGLGETVAAAVAALGSQAPRLSQVSTLADCVAAIRILNPSVVLLDDGVADRAGPELLAEVQRAGPAALVVYIAARHSHDLEREVRRQGVLFYVARPVERETLESTLVHILQGLLRGTA